MTTTTATAQRFTLDEDAAWAWLARGIAQFEGTMEWAQSGAEPDGTLPEIDSDWQPYLEEDGGTIGTLVYEARQAKIITGPENIAVDFEFTSDSDGAGYYWLVRVEGEQGSGRSLTLASGYEELHHLGDGRESAGAGAALAILREAVDRANDCLDRLDAQAPTECDATALDRIAALVAPDWDGGDASDMLMEIRQIVRGTGRKAAR